MKFKVCQYNPNKNGTIAQRFDDIFKYHEAPQALDHYISEHKTHLSSSQNQRHPIGAQELAILSNILEAFPVINAENSEDVKQAIIAGAAPSSSFPLHALPALAAGLEHQLRVIFVANECLYSDALDENIEEEAQLAAVMEASKDLMNNMTPEQMHEQIIAMRDYEREQENVSHVARVLRGTHIGADNADDPMNNMTREEMHEQLIAMRAYERDQKDVSQVARVLQDTHIDADNDNDNDSDDSAKHINRSTRPKPF